jgi:hypothetical protein
VDSDFTRAAASIVRAAALSFDVMVPFPSVSNIRV